MVGDDDSEAGEEGGQEDTHVADVDGDVEGVEEVVDDCRGDHEAWVDGASDDTTEGIPSPVIKPVVELVKALFCKESRVKKLFNVVSGRKKLLSVVSGGKKLLSVVSGGWKGNNSLGGSVVEVGIKLVNDTLVTQHREQSHAKCYLDGLKYLCHSTIKPLPQFGKCMQKQHTQNGSNGENAHLQQGVLLFCRHLHERGQ